MICVNSTGYYVIPFLYDIVNEQNVSEDSFKGVLRGKKHQI